MPLTEGLSISTNSDVILFSNNDIILQSEGGGGKKGQKIASYLMYGPSQKKYLQSFRPLCEFMMSCRLSHPANDRLAIEKKVF